MLLELFSWNYCYFFFNLWLHSNDNIGRMEVDCSIGFHLQIIIWKCIKNNPLEPNILSDIRSLVVQSYILTLTEDKFSLFWARAKRTQHQRLNVLCGTVLLIYLLILCCAPIFDELINFLDQLHRFLPLIAIRARLHLQIKFLFYFWNSKNRL